MKVIDNKSEILRDSLVQTIHKGDKLSIAASTFSLHAFSALMSQFQNTAELRFIFTVPSFTDPDHSKPFVRKNKSFLEPNYLVVSGAESFLHNTLMQKAIAHECIEWIKNQNVFFRSFKANEGMGGFAIINSPAQKELTAYAPLRGFTTIELGCTSKKDNLNLIQNLDAPFAKQYLALFDSVWNDKKKLLDVKEELLKKISALCEENAPDYIYYVTLYNIFHDFWVDLIDEDFSVNERIGYNNSVIWAKLFDFQRDAAYAIINKLERYNGCILADSVGLGKTYTALAVIKYYESRNKNVLVLCPKKLSNNWNTFRGNYINNPLRADRFRYDVLYHTDLSRTGNNAFSNGINIGQLNWGNYDLVVIDESHNFRNGGSPANKKMNRYRLLLEKVIRSGVKTKVLMLSATPVNNRFNDLRNQLALAYEGSDSSVLEKQLSTHNTIDGIFKRAQTAFNKWSELPPQNRTTDALIKTLDFDFFELLDSVTIARSRRQVKAHYNMSAIGAFPKRLAPIAVSPNLTNLPHTPNYDSIFDSLLSLWLSVYTPSHYILPERRHLYAEQFKDNVDNKEFSQENREQGIRRLMAINLMKRLESSIYSFILTLNRIEELIINTLSLIDSFHDAKTSLYTEELDLDIEDDEIQDELFVVGKKAKINLRDMNLPAWQETLQEDLEVIESLKEHVSIITAAHDCKLIKLQNIIKEKHFSPINSGNSKILIFTAFSDTAEYLYSHISRFAKQYGLNTAMITGTSNGKSTIEGLHCDFDTLLTCFSPISKGRDSLQYDSIAANATIDILIGTDCISEGQNLQDCDFCINYDIHWNPVRIIQRYGRIDRIGSRNAVIQLVNFWPDVSLDDYINLKQRVETRMKIVNITATPEEKVLSDEEKVDLDYRKAQLEKLKTEILDVEEITTGVSITDLGLNEFKLDLINYSKSNKWDSKPRTGIYAVVKSSPSSPKGMILVLKNISMNARIKTTNRLHPYYLVYISEQGTIIHNHLNPTAVLATLKRLCKGIDSPITELCDAFNAETEFGKDMSKYINLLNHSIESIVEVKKEADIAGLFKSGGTNFSKTQKIEGLNDFELICFLAVK